MEMLASGDLMDRFEAVLPRTDRADDARRILDVMAGICRAASAAALRERAGKMRWLAGDRVPDDVMAAIRQALASQRARVLSGTTFTDAASGGGSARAWLMWTRRPNDHGFDVVYLAGPALRPHEDAAEHLARLAGLLGGLP
jgi:hypothetical protein